MPITHNMQLTPDKINCQRHRLQDPGGDNLYVIVGTGDQGQPIEVSASFVNETDHNKKEVLSSWTLACKLVSRSLSSGIAVKEILDDLDHSKVFPRDVPSQMFNVLNHYS